MEKFIKNLATLGYFGYFPASGTWGSLVALPCAYALSFLPCVYHYVFIIVAMLLALYIIDRSLPCFASQDPSEIIIDEFVGMLLALLAMPYNGYMYIFGFLAFRVLDIFKLFGISYIEKLPGAFGVLFDDCCAGLYVYLMIRLFFAC